MNNAQKSCCILAVSFGVCFNVLGMKAFQRANLPPPHPPVVTHSQPALIVQPSEVITSRNPIINQHTDDVNTPPAYPPVDMYIHNPYELVIQQPQGIIPGGSRQFANTMFTSAKLGNVTVEIDSSSKAWKVIPDKGHGNTEIYYTKKTFFKKPAPQELIREMISFRLGAGNTEELLTAMYQELYNQLVTMKIVNGEISMVDTEFNKVLFHSLGIDYILKHKTLKPEEKFVCIGRMLKHGKIDKQYGKKISIMKRIDDGELTVMDALFWYNSHQQ